MDLNIIDKSGNVTVDALLNHGKNYFNMAALKPGYLSGTGAVLSTGNPSITLTDGDYIYNATGTSQYIGFHYEDYIAVEPESKYTFSRDWAVPLSRTVTFYYYDADKSLISSSSSSADPVIQLTTPANCKYMRMSCNNIYGYPFTIGNTMVEIGHYNSSAYENPPIATTYEAYVSYTGFSLEYQKAAPNIYDTVFDEILEQQTGFSAASTLKAMFETNNEAINYLDWNNLSPLAATSRVDGEEFIVKSADTLPHVLIYSGIDLDLDDIYYVRAEVKRLNEEINAFFVSQASTQIDTLQEHEIYNDNLDIFNVLGGKVTGVAAPANYLRFNQQCATGGTYGEYEAAWKNFVVLNLTDNSLTYMSEANIESLYATYRKYKYPNLLTGSEIITDYISRKIYIDYDNQIAHNLTTIYGAGLEPTLEEHEALIPQYTNIVLKAKAKAFANTLQQEFMELTLTTPINLLEDYTLTDVFVNSQAVSTPQATLDILEDIYETLAETTILTGTAFVLGQFYVDYDNFKAYDIVDINRRLPVYNNLSLNQIFGTYDTTGATVIEEATTPTRSIVLLNGNYYYINGDYTANTYGTLYTMAQYDSMLEYYKGEVLELLSVKSSLDTPVYENLSLRDIFETNNLVVNGDFESGFSLWLNPQYFTYDIVNKNIIFNGFTSTVLLAQLIALNGNYYFGYELVASNSPSIGVYDGVSYVVAMSLRNTGIVGGTFTSNSGTRVSIAISQNTGLGSVFDNVYLLDLSIFTTAPSQVQLDEWLADYLALKDNETLITDYLAKTRMLPLIEKMWIERDRVVILGSYTVIGE